MSQQGGGGSAFGMHLFQNNLYASGNIAGDIYSHFLGRWDGQLWDTLGLVMDGAIGAFKIFNGNLIMGGDFENAGNLHGKYLASYTGAIWDTFPTYNWQRDRKSTRLNSSHG